MSKLFLKYLSIIFSIYIVSRILSTVYIGSSIAILVMGLVLLLVNLVIKPILLLISLPVNLLTFGLFSFVVNALTILIAAGLVPGISMGGFWSAMLTALFIVIFNNLLIDMNKPTKRRE
ncbi:MAG: phage holin family protein [Oscillospiraceae bacterium]|nr:phage holin family protein [Oscillospiraceae bacterium]